MSTVKFTLNNNDVTYDGPSQDSLLDVLRNTFELTSVKCGCREGECGACAVLIDGKLTNSCLAAIGSIDGASVMTLEGYRETDRFKVMEKAFDKMSAVQCGFCTPGMVMAAEALLSSNPNPTEEEVRNKMAGNLCRCTGYNAIVKAILETAKEGQGLW